MSGKWSRYCEVGYLAQRIQPDDRNPLRELAGYGKGQHAHTKVLRFGTVDEIAASAALYSEILV
jgi:hypothetical protein